MNKKNASNDKSIKLELDIAPLIRGSHQMNKKFNAIEVLMLLVITLLLPLILSFCV